MKNLPSVNYNANSVAGQVYKGSLTYQDYSVTKVEYDRVERTQLQSNKVNILKHILLSHIKQF